jgi:hypothetical protein
MSCPVGRVAISGVMAGSMRFVFQQGGPLAVVRRQSDGKSYRVQATPLSATLRRRARLNPAARLSPARGREAPGSTPAPSTAEDLKDMGIGIVGHRRTLLDAIAAARPRARRDRGGAGGRGAAAAGRLRAAHMLAARCSQGGSVGSGNSAQPPLGPQPRASATSSTARSTPLWPPERLSTPPRTCRFVCNANLRCGTRTGQTPTRLLRPACRPTASRRSFWSQVISAGGGQRTRARASPNSPVRRPGSSTRRRILRNAGGRHSFLN